MERVPGASRSVQRTSRHQRVAAHLAVARDGEVDDGLTAKEGMEYCKQLFGESAAIAVVEPPYKSMGDDLATGGRWYWSDTFSEDTSSDVL